MPNDNKHGTVIQRTRWRIRDLYRELKPCRFSLLVALIAWLVFVCVAQGIEILRTVGEGFAIDRHWNLGPRLHFLFGVDSVGDH
jgi:hypothetical protein